MLNQSFMARRTLQEVLTVFEAHDLNVAETERALGLVLGKLTTRIKSRKWFSFFKERYPGRFNYTGVRGCYEDIETCKIPCMTPGCEKMAVVKVLRGEPIPKGMRKWCDRCARESRIISAGCFKTGGGEVDQMSTW